MDDFVAKKVKIKELIHQMYQELRRIYVILAIMFLLK